MGRIYKQKGSRFYWVAYYHQGRQVRESSRSTREGDARRLLKKRVAEIETHTFVGPCSDRVLFQELLEAVERDYVLNNRRDLSMLRYRMRIVRETFGADRAARITTQRIERFKEEQLAKQKAPATVNRYLALIRRAFRLGMKQKLINAMPSIETLREDNVREGFLEPKELQPVLVHLSEVLQDVALFAYLSAWRRREVTKLLWKKVDIENRLINLSGRNSKNYKARILPLEGELWEIIQRRMAARAVHKPTGEILLSEFVFHRGGKEIKDFRGAWDNACHLAGKPDLLFHDLRRSGIRNLTRSGTPERIAMEISGHVTRATFDRYNIVDEQDLRLAMRKAQNYIDQKRNPQEPGQEAAGDGRTGVRA